MAINYPNKYFNRFDPTKNYKKLLFLSDQGLQAAELNEIQDTILNELKSISSYLIKNGTILSGGEINGVTDLYISILDGQVYADGFTISVGARHVPILGTGLEIVGMAVSNSMVTDLDDPTIREPDIESPNYGQPGSFRLAKTGVWKRSSEVTSNELFFPILTIADGKLVSTSSSSDYTTQINNLIGKYDYETNGSYLLSGIDVSYASTSTDGSIHLNISSGKARVSGQFLTNQYQKTVVLDKLDDTRSVVGEPYVFTGNKDYPLRYSPIDVITKIQGIKRFTQNVVHGMYSGSSDLLSKTPVLSIETIQQGSTTYRNGVDFISNGDSVDWSPSGAEPSPGSTYSATYTYVDSFVAPITIDKKSITVANLVADSTFFVNYSYLLKRIDRVSINSSGEFIVSRGTPGYSSYFAPPKATHLLSLATVDLSSGSVPKISVDTTYNMTFDELSNIMSKINVLESNVAHLSLLENARSTDAMTNKRNLIVDPLFDNDLRDLGESNSLTLRDRELFIGSVFTVGGVTSSVVHLPMTESVELQQLRMTGNRKINPYISSSTPILAGMEINPSVISVSKQLWSRSTDSSVLNTTTSFIVKLSRFSPGESVRVTLNSSNQAVTMNNNGEGQVTLSLPVGTKLGSYKIDAVGLLSNSVASNTITVGDASIGNSYSQSSTISVDREPLAQSFQPSSEYSLSSISIYVTEKFSEDLLLTLCKVVVGMPDTKNVLGTGRINSNTVSMGWNKIPLDSPVNVNPDTEYAFVLYTNKPLGGVGTAKVGQFDTISNTWVTSQASSGVLFVSSNLLSWSPVQDEDLTFKLNKAIFSVSSTTELLSMNVSGITDWFLSGSSSVPDETSVRYYIEDSVGNKFDIDIDTPLYTNSISGAVKLKVDLLTSNVNKSPVINKGLTLSIGTADRPGTYTMNSFIVPNGSTSPATIKLVVDIFAPSGTSVIPSVLNFNGYEQMTISSSSPVGDNWYENTYIANSVSLNTSKLRIIADTSSLSVRPKIRKIRVLIS